MTNELSTIANSIDLWEDETRLKEIKAIFAPKLNNNEFAAFIGMGKANDLNPFLREIWSIKYADNAPAQIFIGRDGYRKSAQRNPDYQTHVVESVHEKDEFKFKNGEVHHEYGAVRGKLIGAYCMVYKKSCERPTYVYCLLSEYSTGKSLWNAESGKQATMIKKCFDSETEVLTDMGFQRFDSVTGNVLEVTKNGLIKTESIPFCQNYDGEMIQYEGQYLNFSVTPNHDMITTTGRKSAEDLYNKATKCYRDADRIPAHIISEQPDYPLISDEQIKLAAYFLCDGSHTGYRQFRIAVSRDYKIEQLNRIGLFNRTSIKKDAGRLSDNEIRLINTKKDKTCFTYNFNLIDEICYPDKTINHDVLLKLSQRQAKLFVEAMILFDGAISKSHKKTFYTSNISILKAMELIANIAGYSVGVPTIRWSDISTNPNYCLTISEKSNFPVVTYMHKRPGVFKTTNPSGKVWCVTVPSGTIIVRRNGFSMICGNCAEAQALRMAFQEQYQGTYSEFERHEVIDAEWSPKQSQSDKMNTLLAKKGLNHAKTNNDNGSNASVDTYDTGLCSANSNDSPHANETEVCPGLAADGESKVVTNPTQNVAAKCSEEQLDVISCSIHEKGFDEARKLKALKHFGVSSFAELSEEQADEMIKIIAKVA